MGQFSLGLFDDLSLYVRHSAWLNANPERPKTDKSDKPIPTRLERLRTDKGDETYPPEMPPIEAAGHLIGYLFEVGPVMPGAACSVPITHQELFAWQTLTGIVLQPWEARTLRLLSGEYIRELREAEKPDREPPWKPADYVPEKLTSAARSLKDQIRGLAAL